jgi:RimJ/RimL family protein N-acetyltransferase
VLRLLGFKQEGLCRQAIYLHGQWQDVATLALLREEFQPVNVDD